MLQTSFFGHDQLVITRIASPCRLGATSLLNISFHTPYLTTLSSFLIIDRDTVHILSPNCHFLMFFFFIKAFFAANPSNFASRVLVSWLAFLFVWIILTPRQIKWDQQYAEFEEHVKMPEIGGPADEFPANFFYFFFAPQNRLREKSQKKRPTADWPKHHFRLPLFFHLALPPPPTEQFVIRLRGAETWGFPESPSFPEFLNLGRVSHECR